MTIEQIYQEMLEHSMQIAAKAARNMGNEIALGEQILEICTLNKCMNMIFPKNNKEGLSAEETRQIEVITSGLENRSVVLRRKVLSDVLHYYRLYR